MIIEKYYDNKKLVHHKNSSFLNLKKVAIAANELKLALVLDYEIIISENKVVLQHPSWEIHYIEVTEKFFLKPEDQEIYHN